MKLHSVSIERLFDLFDYKIPIKNDENVLLITGPNGFGKTMVLNILFNLFNRKFLFFHKLIFRKIEVVLTSHTIAIEKMKDGESPKVKFTFRDGDQEIESFDFTSKVETDIERTIQRFFPVRRFGPDKWIDQFTNRIFTLDEIINEYGEQLPEEVKRNFLKIRSEQVNAILDSIKVHLIREQRLFKQVQDVQKGTHRENQTVMIETILTYAKELKNIIDLYSRESFIRTQELDSTYPDRLIKEQKLLTEQEYTKKYEELKIKQDKLTKFDLYESKQRFLSYSQVDAKALSVYLKDFEIKLGVFDSLLEKLELFTNILNQRRFTFKSININREKGFYFKTNRGTELELNQLSSGEQHEVVLLYELIFNSRTNMVVLIDEPEISLHITWQKEFLNDLLRIIKIQQIQVIVATHSPSIINDRWDLVYNLEKEDIYDPKRRHLSRQTE
jgi:predicted ATP-binding protein involved in virulence